MHSGVLSRKTLQQTPGGTSQCWLRWPGMWADPNQLSVTGDNCVNTTCDALWRQTLRSCLEFTLHTLWGDCQTPPVVSSLKVSGVLELCGCFSFNSPPLEDLLTPEGKKAHCKEWLYLHLFTVVLPLVTHSRSTLQIVLILFLWRLCQ